MGLEELDYKSEIKQLVAECKKSKKRFKNNIEKLISKTEDISEDNEEDISEKEIKEYDNNICQQ